MSSAKREKKISDSTQELKGSGESFQNWILGLYDVTKYSDDELNDIYAQIKYQGFDRQQTLRQFSLLTSDHRLAMQIVVVCALRGPKQASKVKLLNGKTLEVMGVSASGGKGSDRLTCQRITAATADLAAYYLWKMKVPKRIPIDLPGWLQFPAAGSITLPENIRRDHKAFSVRFSQLIGGEFNEQIYLQMTENSYLDPGIKSKLIDLN